MQVEAEITDLKTRLDQLEQTVRRLGNKTPPMPPIVPGQPVSREQLRAYLKARGLILEPTAEMLAAAARWDALPEEEKAAVRWELDHLPPGPMASDIISENRR